MPEKAGEATTNAIVQGVLPSRLKDYHEYFERKKQLFQMAAVVGTLPQGSEVRNEAEVLHACDTAAVLGHIKNIGVDVPKGSRVGYSKAGVGYVPAKFEVEVNSGFLNAT